MKGEIYMKGGLYIVSTPLGNYRDITLRAIDILDEVDAVICEEYCTGSTLIKKLGLAEKDLIQLNEHNEKESSLLIAEELIHGKRYALISDCGTPAFADPGTELIRRCLGNGVPVIPVPGPSSLMVAISLSPLPLGEFYFAGFLPRKKEIRLRKLSDLNKIRIPVILMDAPYRLSRLLSEVIDIFGKARKITLAFDLTLPGEKLLHGSVEHIFQQMKDKKGEFVLVVHS